MPKQLFARPPRDAEEQRRIRKLARSRHAPGDWTCRATMILRGWDGLRTTAIVAELGCHLQTVRERLMRFNAEGIDGLGDRPGTGRTPCLAEAERSTIIGPVATPLRGRLVRDDGGEPAARDEDREAHLPLDALTTAAQQRGIQVSRSPVRRILLAEKVRWRRPHSWATSTDPDFAPKGCGPSPSTPPRRRG